MDIIPTPRNALDNALHRYMYGNHGRGLSGKQDKAIKVGHEMDGDHGSGLSGKHVHLEDKAIKVGHEMAGNLWDAADRKSDELSGIKQLIEEYRPLYTGAVNYVTSQLEGKGKTKEETEKQINERRDMLADSFALEFKEMMTMKKFYMKEIAYTYKEQVNKVYMLERAEKMADKQFLRQLAVATTKFLAVDGPGQITQALNDLVSLLFNDVVQNRREKD
jgi:hypothetical protein